MSHAFDTGLLVAQRSAVRVAAVAIIAQLRRPTGYLNAVVPWGGVIRSYSDDNGIDALWGVLQGRNPAIAIAVGDRRSKPQGMGGYHHTSDLELILYHYSTHRRGDTDGRMSADVVAIADDHADPGLDIMLEHAAELLIGQFAAGPTVKQIIPEAEEELRTEIGHTLWRQTFSIQARQTIRQNRTLTEMLSDIRTSIRTSDPESEDPAPPQITIDNPANT